MLNIQDITFTGKTDTGLKRDHNEDNYVATKLWDSYIFLCVIDGVGGYAGGEICSAAVAEKMEQILKDSEPGGNLEGLLKSALAKANNHIIQMHQEMPEYNNMSCVVTSILVDTANALVYMAHVGDTRLYEYSKGQLLKLSHDHSPVGIREEMGLLSEHEAMNHPRRNIIERCIGDSELDEDTDYIETAVFPFKKGASYLLCSDGLTDMVDSANIIQIVSSEKNVDEKVEELIEAANQAGGKDNITVLLLHNPGEDVEKELFNNELELEIPDNKIETGTSSQLSDTVAEDSEDKIKSDEDAKDINEDNVTDIKIAEDNSRENEKIHNNNGPKIRNILLGSILVLMIGFIALMWCDIQELKEQHTAIKLDSIAKQELNDSLIIARLPDSLKVDSIIVLNGDTTYFLAKPDTTKNNTIKTTDSNGL